MNARQNYDNEWVRSPDPRGGVGPGDASMPQMTAPDSPISIL